VSGGALNLSGNGRLSSGAIATVSSGTLSTGGNETITRLNATGGTVNLTDTLTVTGTNGNASTVASSATLTGGTLSVQGTLAYQSTNNSTSRSGGKWARAGCTRRHSSRGVRLVLLDLNAEALAKAKQELGPRTLALRVDGTDPAAVRKTIDQAAEEAS